MQHRDWRIGRHSRLSIHVANYVAMYTRLGSTEGRLGSHSGLFSSIGSHTCTVDYR